MKNHRRTKTTAQKKSIRKRFNAIDGKTAKKRVCAHPRQLARSVAKAQMERAGWRHINRSFAYNWANVIRQITKAGRKTS